MFAEDIILQPVLTEKGYDGIASKKYTFIVKRDANKTRQGRKRKHPYPQGQTQENGQKRGLHARS